MEISQYYLHIRQYLCIIDIIKGYYEPYCTTYKERQTLKGIAKMKYDRQQGKVKRRKEEI